MAMFGGFFLVWIFVCGGFCVWGFLASLGEGGCCWMGTAFVLFLKFHKGILLNRSIWVVSVFFHIRSVYGLLLHISIFSLLSVTMLSTLLRFAFTETKDIINKTWLMFYNYVIKQNYFRYCLEKLTKGRIESYLDCVLSVFTCCGGVTSFVTSSMIISCFFLQKNINTYF